MSEGNNSDFACNYEDCPCVIFNVSLEFIFFAEIEGCGTVVFFRTCSERKDDLKDEAEPIVKSASRWSGYIIGKV